METTKQPQLTPLMPNKVLGRLERMRINSSRRFTNRSRGEHLRGKGGQSTEFADYRDYVEGDDTRFVDWNIFARLNRPYIKLFQQEEELNVVLLVDASSSMMFDGKLDRAKSIAAAFGIMGLFANERVSAYAFNAKDGKMQMVPRCMGRGSLRKLFTFIENIEGGGNAPLEHGIDLMLKHHRGRGVVLVLSDFLTFNNLAPAFNRLFSNGLEIFGCQILAPAEVDPEVMADLRLVDCETEAILDVSNTGDLLAVYEEYLLAYQRHIERLCQQRNGRACLISSRDPLEHVLFDLMRRKGWIV